MLERSSSEMESSMRRRVERRRTMEIVYED
jgi:hypothetical protein